MRSIFAAIAFALLAISAIAYAVPVTLPDSASLGIIRPCSMQGVASVVVASATGSAATGAALSKGKVLGFCTNRAHIRQAATSPTAVLTDQLFPINVPFELYSEGSFLAVIKETAEVDGSCYFTACR